MNVINHYLFSISLCLLILELTPFNFVLIIIFTFLINAFMDYFHGSIKKAKEKGKPWYRRRTWVEEPFGFIIIGLPIAFILSMIDETFLVLILVPYLSHILLDYLCIFEAHPLAPFSKIKKKEGLGIFIPDDLFIKSENSRKWAKRVKVKKVRRVSENYFTIFNLVLLVIVFLFKFKIF